MGTKSFLGACAVCAIAIASNNAAHAGSYYVGTTVASNPVLWVYAPNTNLIKLCYGTTSNSLACTPTQPVFASALGPNDSMQYRISQQSANGGVWMLDLTTNKEALCSATLPANSYVISCVLGSGLK